VSYQEPDARGHFGQFGGRYVAETLMPALLELEEGLMPEDILVSSEVVMLPKL